MINHLAHSTSDRKSLINTESLKGGIEFYLQRKDDRSSLSCQALSVTELLETALTSRTVCIGGTLKMKREHGLLERT